MLTSNLGGLVSSVDTMGMMMMFGPMLKRYVGDLQGIGMGYALQTERAMVEGVSYIHMPNGKSGLSKLVAQPGSTGDVPGFVGDDAVSYTRFNFDFQGLHPLVQELLNTVGPMMGMPMGGPEGEQIAQQMEMFKQLMSCFGKEVHMAQTLKRPITADSMGTVFALECVKPQEFDQFMSMMGPQMGAEPRDFQGHRIFTMAGNPHGDDEPDGRRHGRATRRCPSASAAA